jgi:hypothetical protein
MSTTILRAIWDPKLFKPWFKGDPKGWQAWFAFLRALFALPMGPDELAIYQQCTGRVDAPTVPATEAWLVCGRRAGKSFMLAITAVYLAAFHEYRKHLAPGERASIMIIARDRKQARVILGYIRALLTEVPMLKAMVVHETADAFELSNAVAIEVHAASFRGVRGYAIVAALLDELAFWPTDDSADPDFEVINALRPGMAQFPNAMLLCASSPYAKRGALYEAYVRHFGKENDPVLVWKAPTTTMNPTIAQSVVDAAIERDPEDASAEWMAEFRSDLASFISRETVMSCVELGMFERPPQPGINYESFIDPSGGSNDSMTCAIGHLDGELVVVDCVREIKAPFDPESAVDEFATLLARYSVRNTNGDRYAAAWVSTAFEKRGVNYRHCELPRSSLYLNLLPHLNSRTIRLLDNPRVVTQISSLERRTARGARDSIDHPRDQHDDLANCVAGLAYVSAQRPVAPGIFLGSYEDPFSGWRAAQERQEGRFRSLREEAESGLWSAPCTLTAEQLASTEPSPEALRRWEAYVAAQERKAAEERQRRSRFATFR